MGVCMRVDAGLVCIAHPCSPIHTHTYQWKDGQGNQGLTPTKAVNTQDYSVTCVCGCVYMCMYTCVHDSTHKMLTPFIYPHPHPHPHPRTHPHPHINIYKQNMQVGGPLLLPRELPGGRGHQPALAPHAPPLRAPGTLFLRC
jgi:hypothetical protein